MAEQKPGAAIDLGSLAGYLSAHGWRAEETAGGQRWTHADEDGVIEELTIANADPQLDHVVAELARVEARDSAVVYAEILHAGADTVQVDLRSTETGEHTITIENGVRLMQGLQRGMVAAAWATHGPMPYLTGKKPPILTQFMRTVRIAPAVPADPGYGYAHAIVAPLREIDQETFSRRAMILLGTALIALNSTLTTATQIADKEVQKGLIAQGVTANLCDAVVLMFGKPATQSKKRGKTGAKLHHRLDFTFTWSPMLAVAAETPHTLSLDAELIPILQDLAALLRETSPKEDFQFQGLVTDLKRSGESGIGKISVNNMTHEEPEKVAMELEEDLYGIAIQAHKDKARVVCIGTLVKNNKSYELINASIATTEPQSVS
jgi:hypothetical protein